MEAATKTQKRKLASKLPGPSSASVTRPGKRQRNGTEGEDTKAAAVSSSTVAPSTSTTRVGVSRPASKTVTACTSTAKGSSVVSSSTSAAKGTALFTVGQKPKTSSRRSAGRVSSTSRTKVKVSKSPKKENCPPTTKPTAKPKRAAWDTKGQLEDLRAEFAEFKHTYKKDIAARDEKTEKLVVEKKEELVGIEKRLTDQLVTAQDENETLKRALDEALGNNHLLEQTRQKELEESTITIKARDEKIEQLTAEINIQNKDLARLRLTEKEHLFELKTKEARIKELTDENDRQMKEIANFEERCRQYEQGERSHEMERRRLHNTIQELKGNIRVFCRVRPNLQAECQQIFSYPDADHKKLTISKGSVDTSMLNETLKRADKLDFEFDRVFAGDSSQHTVFEEISQLVQSSLDGYNVCIFAYGQTGSGKTYTMEGPKNMDETTEGMIPRSIQQVFESAAQLEHLGWKYTMEATFIEIYNETLRDLLGQPGKEQKHEIKVASGSVIVSNLTPVKVTQPRQVEGLFEKARKNRRVAETQCNARSSRSHSVFTLKIFGSNEVTEETSTGTLNLVDLAGSERLKESKSEGDRLRETQNINTSLACLGNVIMSLAAKRSHIPYRDSKLTMLLQDSLGGNSKTLMFVNVSPNEDHLNETVNSLRFATKVNSCSIGTAKKVKSLTTNHYSM